MNHSHDAMRALTLHRSLLTTRNVTWRRVSSFADSSTPTNKSVPVEVDVESEREAIDVTVRGKDMGEARSDPPDGEVVPMQSAEPSRSAVHQGSADPKSQTGNSGRQETSPPVESEPGNPPMRGPCQESLDFSVKFLAPHPLKSHK